jgi:signal transduction histidine kinase
VATRRPRFVGRQEAIGCGDGRSRRVPVRRSAYRGAISYSAGSNRGRPGAWMSAACAVPYVRVVREGEPGWAQRRREWPARPGWPGGAVIAAALFHVLGARAVDRDGALLRDLDVLGYALLLAGPLALWWRRRAPVVVLAVAAAASIGYALSAAPRWSFAVAPVIALFAAVKAGHRRAAVVVAGAGYALYLLLTVVLADALGVPPAARPDLRVALLAAAGLILTVILAGAAKVRREHFAEMAKVQAERARARAEQQRRQASEERLRIAQELHDVLGHHLSLISVQAGVGLHLMDSRPEQARAALTAIKSASAEALREVRSVLGVLRPDEEAAPRQPALGLDRLAELTAEAGLPVDTRIGGAPRPLPAEVDRAAYRIVQEALTNVRRHATPGARAVVTIGYDDAALTLSVSNDGPAPPAADGPADAASTTGNGIAGMRARAESLGGRLDAGPVPGGYRVHAVMPAREFG